VSGPHIPVLGVVPLVHDDRQAPGGCAALRRLRDVPLVRRAVGALVRSGAVDSVLVPVPPALVDEIDEVLAPLPRPVKVEVLGIRDNGPGARLLAALTVRTAPEGGAVVVHDPLHPLAPAALVAAVVATLLGATEGDCAGVLPVRPVTDTLKWVDDDDVVTGTADREGFRMVYSPQAYRTEVLMRALSGADAAMLRAVGADRLPRLVQGVGGTLHTVPAPGEVFRIATAEDLVLADAMLHVGADVDDERGSR
jgi:2-C-methyl-D-erythritol 4-phosphate cytidylyltransferase